MTCHSERSDESTYFYRTLVILNKEKEVDQIVSLFFLIDCNSTAKTSLHKAISYVHKAISYVHKAISYVHKTMNAVHKAMSSVHKAMDTLH